MTRIPLGGSDWQFKDYYGEDWLWRDAHKPGTRDLRHWRTGTVPGSVHHDLWQIGEVPNPYFERNSLLLEWIPARTWLYKKTFSVDEALRDKRVRLCFEGVDYEAQFFLNGERLGDHIGMFTPAVFEVSDHLNYGGENLLAVVIEPAPHEQPQVSRTSKVRTHKSRMTYWWDFCPRMIHIGIWDQVYLDVTGAMTLDNVFVRPTLSEDLHRAEIAIIAEIDSTVPGHAEVEAVVTFEGAVIASARTTVEGVSGRTPIVLNLPVDQPRLWFPNGYGEQPLYTAEVRVIADGTVSDEKHIRFGIRHITLIPNENADPAALPYTFVVNGEKVYLNGWNWVPMDVLYGVERPDKLEHLLMLAKDAHVNLLRVWGGGLIEKESFYDRCDELGIMVWQEFIQSSSGIENTPTNDPVSVGMIGNEAELIVPRKRNHPALAIWCGGNELTTPEIVPLTDEHPVLGALHSVVARLDPDRIWLPTSPSGRKFGNTLENIDADPTGLHDVHGPWEYQGVVNHYTLYNRSTSLLHSEFGVEGVTNQRTLDATISPENQQPPTLDNPIWQHLGAWWNQAKMWREVFGEISDIPTLIRATQFMQAEGLRYAVEADRRRAFQNSGTLPWQFNEPYPMATCTSAVDYYGQAKPSYYAVACAYEPLHISARFSRIAWSNMPEFEASIWLNQTHPLPAAPATLSIRLTAMNGDSITGHFEQIALPSSPSAEIATFRYLLKAIPGDVFFLSLELRFSRDDQEQVARNHYTFTKGANLAPLLSLPPAQLAAQVDDNGDQWRLHVANQGDHVAQGVWLEDARPVGGVGYVRFSDNAFTLFPGETKTVTVSWGSVPQRERRLNIGAWNGTCSDRSRAR